MRTAATGTILALFLAMQGRAQSDKTQGTTYRAPDGTLLRLILDQTNIGSEVSVGEIRFQPNTDTGEHVHGAIEIFYVISGELEQVVNGKSQFLKAGMAGYVKPPAQASGSEVKR